MAVLFDGRRTSRESWALSRRMGECPSPVTSRKRSFGSCTSALTKNQVIAFVISVAVGLGFVLSGFSMVLDLFSGWAPQFVVELISSFSFLTHFNALSRGVIDLRDLVYFLSLIGFWLFATALMLEWKKAE